MEAKNQPDATIFVIFGAAGDLTWRKLIPALYNLHLDSWMPMFRKTDSLCQRCSYGVRRRDAVAAARA